MRRDWIESQRPRRKITNEEAQMTKELPTSNVEVFIRFPLTRDRVDTLPPDVRDGVCDFCSGVVTVSALIALASPIAASVSLVIRLGLVALVAVAA
jgi:hypothetical protein